MNKSLKSLLIGGFVFLVLLIVGLLIVDGNWYWLRYASIFGGKEKAAELDYASLVVTGSDVGASKWVQWGDKAAWGVAVIILGISILVVFGIIALPNKAKHKNIPFQNTDADVLEKLSRLHDSGILTDEEFQKKKSDILERM